MATTILCGDALEQMRVLEPESIYTCVTSPPYYHLRDYGVPGQIGMEPTPESYIDRLVSVFQEVRRVLRSDGTLWLNIGDSYQDKSLIGIPWLLALALRSDGWYLRQDIIWHKTNCMPESVRDRCTKSHEYLFLLSKSKRYYFDSAAISEPVIGNSTKRYLRSVESQIRYNPQVKDESEVIRTALPRFGGEKYGSDDSEESRTKSGNVYIPTAFRNKRDVWALGTSGFKEAHFAVFPEKLVEPCVLAGCPEGGTVLDPFTGSGTTGLVANRLNRHFVGVEINPEYCELAERRIAESILLL